VQADRSLIHVRYTLTRLLTSLTVHTHADQVVDAEIFLHEPDFIQQLADLVQPNKAVPMGVRTVALLALDTCCRVGTRVNDVTAALSVSVNHGTLMSILRKLAVDLHNDHRECVTLSAA
jgi:E3 ubiquitin-protein ligase HUWE1